MRVTEISVKGLFGTFDHVIPLNLEDRITIIHGPNGVGKTVLLKMINALFNGRYSQFRDLTFNEFSVAFDDESAIQVTNQPVLKIELSKPDTKKKEFLPPDQDPGKLEFKPGWLANIQNTIPARLVETQRLLIFAERKLLGISSERLKPRREQPQPSRYEHYLAVENCARNLSKKIQSTLAESAEVSQSLERTFPSRLVQKEFSSLPENELRAQLKHLEQEQARLASVGLLTNGNGLEFESTLPIDEQNINALSIYVQDAQKKLGVFDKLADRLNLLKRIVEQKFLYKKLSISKEEGLIFTTTDNQIIPLSGLSSGEQHELVLLYDLLFNTKAGSLILIDEPEISLHLAWQVNFLRDLQEISQLASLDIILATHSPEIIHDRWDLTVELKGPVQ